mmetsp:Transcript_8322/g.19302  ORF Transcript_8322/g.19302 Transcript_8322/m.19302 type:complete len:422 (-) Transcript_8322:400-1665(-)
MLSSRPSPTWRWTYSPAPYVGPVFFRIVVTILCFQFFVVWWWWGALKGALGHGSGFWFLVAFLAGKWASGTVARVLGFVASGGITSWFVQQSIIMEEMDKLKDSQKSAPTTEEETTENETPSNMPEEYRSANADAYQPVLDIDEGIDDDYEEEDVPSRPKLWTDGWTDSGTSTVKGFLVSALTVSFGSVAQCGLLGGLAQFVWSVLRNVEAATTGFSQRFESSSRFGFRGMQIGRDGSDGTSVVWNALIRARSMARNFVRSHTDLAMCQVAAYYKSFQRAAQDVAILVDDSGKKREIAFVTAISFTFSDGESSGVEPIIHDDITTHMCACVCGSISGAITMFIGLILVHHQSNDKMGDTTVAQSMLLAFIMCYTLLFTVMEPLRAAIKAIYVCFAQHPRSLSQSFPLIFHRLSRISEANLV